MIQIKRPYQEFQDCKANQALSAYNDFWYSNLNSNGGSKFVTDCIIIN